MVMESGNNASKDGQAEYSATGMNPNLPGFALKNLDKHFGSGFDSDHSGQYPELTKEQYAKRAHDLVRAAVNDHILGYKAANGNIVRFDESTNDFVKCGKNGIMTMFKPDEQTLYFERQMLRDGGMTND